jgi:hypothetical protein
MYTATAMNASDTKNRDNLLGQRPRGHHVPGQARLKPVKAGLSQLKPDKAINDTAPRFTFHVSRSMPVKVGQT